MKNYLAKMVDLTGNIYLNPVGKPYQDGSGLHQRAESNIKSISIHHDASFRPHNYDSVARYMQEAKGHYSRLGQGLQYHYKIDNTGTIFKIRPHTTWLYVVGSSENVSCLAICLDGYLHNDSTNQGQDPTREQLEALYQLLEFLCTKQPQFPATWPNVRPHADYSATACCGNRFTGMIYPIQNKQTAQDQLLNRGVYDWPALQSSPLPNPVPVTPPVSTPAPAPAVTTEKVTPAVYVAQVNTHLDDVFTGQQISQYPAGTEFSIVNRLRKNGETWLQTAYSAEKTPNRAIPEKDLLLKETGTKPTSPSTPVDIPTPPPVPTTPPADTSHAEVIDIVKENNSLLKSILALLTAFVESVGKLFNLGGK